MRASSSNQRGFIATARLMSASASASLPACINIAPRQKINSSFSGTISSAAS